MSNTKTKQHELEMAYLGNLLDGTSKNEQSDTEVNKLPFMCQLIKVAGLKLALPLSSFSHILKWSEILESVEAKDDSGLEKIQIGDHKIRVIDMANIVLTTDKLEKLINTRKSKWDSIIIMQDIRFGLVCDEVLDAVMIAPEKVCWRGLSSQRFWLAGTVKSGGYALLDIDELLDSL